MAAKIKFILGLHCHQPVGNFDDVFQRGVDTSYRPFLDVVSRFPRIKVVLHYSGPLLEWISEHDPSFFSLVKKLAASGQAEIAGGGHNEPILPVVPRRDAVGQIRHMSRYLKRQFGVTVRGGWLTERIWEPHMPALLSEAGLEYTTTDDYHFLAAGFDPEQLQGYYLSEDQGKFVAIFPISQQLRYMVPFREVDEVIAYFRRKAGELPEGSVLTLADDGEKFGMWPGTYNWVYERGWLEKFFTALSENSDWLETTTFSAVLDSKPASGKVYLPAASYMEMGGWSLPAGAGERFHKLQSELDHQGRMAEFFPFMRGSFWRNFLVKYPESGWMHGRMWQVSDRVAEALKPEAYAAANPPAALQDLWRGQTNCPYWHGIFGGLYLPHLRKAIFSHLIRAEKAALRSAGVKGARVELRDMDRDGEDEIILAGNKASLVIKPSDGGTIAELDSMDAEFNLTDTLARRPEAYHYKMVEGGEEERHGDQSHASIHERHFEDKIPAADMIYDKFTRRMFRVHLFASRPQSAVQLARGEAADTGDFAGGAWTAGAPRVRDGLAQLALTRSGSVTLPDGFTAGIEAAKKIDVSGAKGDIGLSLKLKNHGERELELYLGLAFNLTVLGPADPAVGLRVDSAMYCLAEPLDLGSCREFAVYNHRDGWQLTFAPDKAPLALYQYPVHTVSQSEGGVDHTYQATCLVPVWKINLRPGGSSGISLGLTLSK